MEFRLKELRKKKGLSQVRLAIDLCIPQNSISRFENGVRMPDYFTLIQIADYFNVSIDYLVGRSNNPSIK
ncbi:MAG TPA: XRE family transcriptional regulator [Lachnospiraceae bacterium]|nr:XRE family transcriptional regulator [Lachnospiraceae bacterium]